MTRIIWRIALRLAACAAVIGVVYRWQGLVGLVTCTPLIGIALARPLLDLSSEALRLAERLSLRAVEGRHFVYRGEPIDITEDAAHRRWLRVADVRKVIRRLPDDRLLARAYPAGWQPAGSPPSDAHRAGAHPAFGRPRAGSAPARIEAEALAACLAKVTDPSSIKFGLWLERDVTFPARRLRQRSADLRSKDPSSEDPRRFEPSA